MMILDGDGISSGLFVCYFPSWTNGMQKFPGQGSNLSHSSDNASSITHGATSEVPISNVLNAFCLFMNTFWILQMPWDFLLYSTNIV